MTWVDTALSLEKYPNYVLTILSPSKQTEPKKTFMPKLIEWIIVRCPSFLVWKRFYRKTNSSVQIISFHCDHFTWNKNWFWYCGTRTRCWWHQHGKHWLSASKTEFRWLSKTELVWKEKQPVNNGEMKMFSGNFAIFTYFQCTINDFKLLKFYLKRRKAINLQIIDTLTLKKSIKCIYGLKSCKTSKFYRIFER